MSVINNAIKFGKKVGYCVGQGVKEDVNSYKDIATDIGRATGFAAGAKAGGEVAVKETSHMFYKESAVKVAGKVITKGASKAIGGVVGLAPDIYHVVHGTAKAWQSYGH